jgi:hypothetical protein
MDPNVGEGPGHLERLPPTKTKSHEDKAIVAYGVPILEIKITSI